MPRSLKFFMLCKVLCLSFLLLFYFCWGQRERGALQTKRDGLIGLSGMFLALKCSKSAQKPCD